MKGFAKLGKGVLKVTSAVKKSGGVFKALKVALGGVSGTVLAVVAVIAVLVAAFVNLWKNNEEFRNKIIAIWEGIKAKFQAFAKGITDRLNALGFDFKNITEVLKAIWDGFCQVLAPVFEAAFEVISTVLGTVLDVLTGLFDVFAGIFHRKLGAGVDRRQGDFLRNMERNQIIFSTVLNMLKSIADVFLGWFGTDWDTVWTSVKTFFVNTWNSIKTFFTNAINGIKNRWRPRYGMLSLVSLRRC
jgi:phage-related protein